MAEGLKSYIERRRQEGKTLQFSNVGPGNRPGSWDQESGSTYFRPEQTWAKETEAELNRPASGFDYSEDVGQRFPTTPKAPTFSTGSILNNALGELQKHIPGIVKHTLGGKEVPQTDEEKKAVQKNIQAYFKMIRTDLEKQASLDAKGVSPKQKDFEYYKGLARDDKTAFEGLYGKKGGDTASFADKEQYKYLVGRLKDFDDQLTGEFSKYLTDEERAKIQNERKTILDGMMAIENKMGGKGGMQRAQGDQGSGKKTGQGMDKRAAIKQVADAGASKEDILNFIKQNPQASVDDFLANFGVGPGSKKDENTRVDGTEKGKGFLGVLKRPDGKVSTELSVGVNIDGKETLIPSLVPTLNKKEIDHLLNGGKTTKAIIDKAVAHARKRIADGKSPFADESDVGNIESASNLDARSEKEFKGWYKNYADELGLNPDPDDPKHFYDYRAAFLQGAEPKSPIDDIQQREPSESEIEYFQNNKNVSGMAAEDGNVILNPFSPLSEQEKQSVLRNEKARAYMRSGGPRPDFKITDEQRKKFKGYGSEQDIKETIAARILSGDPSSGASTKEQQKWVRDNLSPHWPSEFKTKGHPRMNIGGMNTKTGQPEEVPDMKNTPVNKTQQSSSGVSPDQPEGMQRKSVPMKTNPLAAPTKEQTEAAHQELADLADQLGVGAEDWKAAGENYQALGKLAKEVGGWAWDAYTRAIGALLAGQEEARKGLPAYGGQG